MMKTLVVVCGLIFLIAALGFPQSQAVLKEISGKVEIQPPRQNWLPAREGMTVSLGATISTGFNSTAVLDLGRSVLQVKPLTRLRIDELIEKEGTLQTDLFLRVGKVKVEVKSTTGLTQDFKLRSPVSTAAVRGTGFEYSGYDLWVFEGNVYYWNNIEQGREIGPGEGSQTSGYEIPISGEDTNNNNSGVNPYAPGAGGKPGRRLTSDLTSIATGSVTVVIPNPIME